MVRAPWLTQGYFKNPGGLGDAVGRRLSAHQRHRHASTRHGYLQITDRLKDVIKTGGEWVSSLEIEDIISQHPAVSEVAVIGVKDDKWGERPKAVIVLKSGHNGTLAADDIKAFIKTYADRGIISKFGIPQDIVFVEVADQDQRRQAQQASPARSLPERMTRSPRQSGIPFLILG